MTMLDLIRDRCDTDGPCWIWQGAVYKTRHGRYPRATIDGEQWLVRRLALMQRLPPNGVQSRVYDVCKESLCCNPEHLRWRSMAAQNKARNWSPVSRLLHGSRVSRGIKNGKRLSLEIAREMRALAPSSVAEMDAIAKQYGVNPRTVQAVIYNETWRDPALSHVWKLP